jgi:hypothetical protein
MRIIAFSLLFICFTCWAQFDPAGGELGSKSIHKDASSIIGWASGAVLVRGYAQINDTSAGKPTIGTESSALGPFNGDVVSLGDGGSITLTFDKPIVNNESYDFAVFENGFKVGLSYYLELAHVEVSEDGITYIRFPSESLSDTSFQIDNFAYIAPQNIYNLAGKHQAPFGTLFDLEELGLQQINYVRLRDVVGSLNDSFGSRDGKGRIINDPFPSPFPSGGFDLDAVAVVKGTLLKREEIVLEGVAIYPTPAQVNQEIQIRAPEGATIQISDMQGRLVSSNTAKSIKLEEIGIYIISIRRGNEVWQQKVVIY